MTIEKCNILVENRITSRQAELDAAASKARAAFTLALRAACVEGVTDPDELLICETVAALMVVGRDDGYPDVKLPDYVRTMLTRSVRAGIIGHKTGSVNWHDGFDGPRESIPGWRDAYEAWEAARNYRERNARKA